MIFYKHIVHIEHIVCPSFRRKNYVFYVNYVFTKKTIYGTPYRTPYAIYHLPFSIYHLAILLYMNRSIANPFLRITSDCGAVECE